MNEENKFYNKNIIKTVSKISNQYEKKENIIKKRSPQFNLVSLKARQRLNLFKKILSKYEYKDYIRKCKNMYSISSLMNSHYSISDLYHTERTNIPNIINLFNKIDSKLSPKKIQYKKINKKNEDSIGFDNDYKNNNSNNETINKNNNNGNSNESESLSNFIRKKIRNRTINYNNKKLNFFSFNQNIKRTSSFNEVPFNKMLNNTYSHQLRNINNDNNINTIFAYNNKKVLFSDNNIKNYHSLNNIHSSRNSNKKSLSSFSKSRKEFGNKKYTNVFKINRKHINDFNVKSNSQKKLSLPNKDKEFSITHFGAIIYNNSIFRNKGIEHFLSDYYNLPLLYNNNINKIKK